MKRSTLLYWPLLAVALLFAAGCSPDAEDPTASSDPAAVADRPERLPDVDPTSPDPEALEYPFTRIVEVVDNYHGTEVNDPYRWLEADVRESDEVAEWVAAQNVVTSAYLEQLDDREYFAERLGELWNYERFGLPERRGDRYFFTRNDGLQDQAVLYVQDSLDGEPRVLIDPNTWSEDGTIDLAQWVPGPDGRYVAYGIQDGGSDWRTWRVIALALFTTESRAATILTAAGG